MTIKNESIVGKQGLSRDSSGHILGYFSFGIILSALFVTDDLCVLAFYHLRSERHAEEELDRALRGILGQLTARHYRHFLMTIRAG